MKEPQLKIKYHVDCEKCGHLWWSKTAFPKRCPKCNARQHLVR